MKKINNYKDLIGVKINEISQDEFYFYFITDEKYIIRIPKFEPYCACYVGEYIDEITTNGTCFGVITDIKTKIDNFEEYEYNETVYKGEVTFYFDNGKINMKVHGEDNGYYGVSFTMPVEILEE